MLIITVLIITTIIKMLIITTIIKILIVQSTKYKILRKY